MTTMKIRYEKLGGHYHCAIFTAIADGMTYAKCGDVVFDEREWPDIQIIFSKARLEERRAS